MEGIDRRQNGAGIVHILKFYGFYEVVYVIPWLGASFAKNCGTPKFVLSLFPGAELLDRAFEEQWFVVVRGADLGR